MHTSKECVSFQREKTEERREKKAESDRQWEEAEEEEEEACEAGRGDGNLSHVFTMFLKT